MERLHVFDCSNVLIASFFTDDRGCAHENREHTLIYLCPVSSKSRSAAGKRCCIRASVLSCGGITGCGCRNMPMQSIRTVLSC